ncbi:MAG: DNA adenine methylase [Clostridiales bacterium]|nr:DNA adenine methylase [Clostridiales bacterium]
MKSVVSKKAIDNGYIYQGQLEYAQPKFYISESFLQAKPFLKWAGGKAQILKEIRTKYPAGLGTTITKYAEPFVGGGAVLFDILSNYKLDEVYISDINRELIITYLNVRDNIDELVENLRVLEQEYLKVDMNSRKIYYYNKREKFNALKKEKSQGAELAALFIFLNRTCFNGLYRVNSKDEFNVPMGNYKNPSICDELNLRKVAEKLQNVRIVCGDYKESRDFIDNRTFAYFDPPYRPLSATSSFTSYAQNGFDDCHQIELARFVDEISQKGAFVVVSNSDPKNIDESDEFFDKLYSKHNICRIGAMRMINSVGNGRGKISELLISTY